MTASQSPTAARPGADGPSASPKPSSLGWTARTRAQRFGRQAVLVTPLVLVNAAAVYGQVQWATVNLTRSSIGLAVVFALTVESIAVYLAYEAHAALLAGDASFRLRVSSYLAAGLVGVLNYSHFAGPGLRPTAAALAFGALSSISPWLWSIRSRSLRRDQLRATGLIDLRTAHFASAKWVNFPIRTFRTYRWSVDHGTQEERAAWEAYRAARDRRRAGKTQPATPATTEATSQTRGQVGAPPSMRSATGGRQSKTRALAGSASSSPTTPGRSADASSDGDDGWGAAERRDGPGSNGYGATGTAVDGARTENGGMASSEVEDLRTRVQNAMASGDRVTGEIVGQWLGVSARTGRRRLATLHNSHPALRGSA